MGDSNYDWAALVMVRCTPPISPTANNCGNFTRWMGAENPRADWWHKNNPLNCGLDDGSADGEGSYPNLDFAATETAKTLSQSNMAPIADALRANASTAVFSAGCAASPWSTGYRGKPGFIASVPQEAVIASPFTFPTAGPTPAPPAPSPTPKPPIPTPQETDMADHCTDPGNGEVWSTNADGAFFAPPISPGGTGDQFIQGLNQHPAYDAGSSESGGTNPCVGITPWKDSTGAWGVCFITQPTNGAGSYGTPYHYYCFNRNGSAA